MIKSRLISQFSNPHGLLGRVAGQIMATRDSNVDRNIWIAGLLDPDPSAQILEVGHGPGIAIEQLWPNLNGGHIVGLDVSELMSSTARKRNQAGVDRGTVEFRVGDAQQIPPDLQDFDVIFGVNVSQFWIDPRDTISQMADRLSEDGSITLVYMQPPTVDYPAERVADELIGHFEAAGLTRIETRRFDFEPPAIAVTGFRPN